MAAKTSTERTVERKHFTTSRELDYLSIKELITQTGHQPDEWLLVILKELVDNSLDACEESGVAPEICVTVEGSKITVADNGPGIPPEVIDRVLDFNVRVSSREAYIAPDRGAQGNALKTIVSMPFALFGSGNVFVEARGVRHEISISVDQVQQTPRIRHETTAIPEQPGTTVTVVFSEEQPRLIEPDDSDQILQDDDEEGDLANQLWNAFCAPCFPEDDGEGDLPRLFSVTARDHFLQLCEDYAWLNPHLTLKARWNGEEHSVSIDRVCDNWKKWLPSFPTDPHWYDDPGFQRLIAAHLSHGETSTVRELITQFRGLSSTLKCKRVLEQCDMARLPLSDLVVDGEFKTDEVTQLLSVMKSETKPVKPRALGVIGEEHFRRRCELAGGEMASFKYKKVEAVREDGIPYVLETAFCHCPKATKRHLVTGVNWSPGIVNPFRQLGSFGGSLDSVLSEAFVDRKQPVVFVLHVACPKVSYADRGKSSVVVEN